MIICPKSFLETSPREPCCPSLCRTDPARGLQRPGRVTKVSFLSDSPHKKKSLGQRAPSLSAEIRSHSGFLATAFFALDARSSFLTIRRLFLLFRLTWF